MGLFDMFGAGGGKLTIQLSSPHVAPGQAVVGNVVFEGGSRAQQIDALTIRVTQETRTMQMTNQGPQARTQSRDVVPATPLTHPFQSSPNQPTALPFSLQLPPDLPGSIPQQVTYHLRASADIPREVDPGASVEIQVVGNVQPGMGQPGMMQPGMMQPGMMQPGMMQPGMMQPGMMQPGMMQPGMMQPGMMQPGMMQPGMMGAAAGMAGGMAAMGGMPMQIAPNTRVYAQWQGDGQLHPATVRGFQNGYYQVDWQEPQLGANSYVLPQQIQMPTQGGPGAGPAAAMQPGMAAKQMDPYAKQGAPQQGFAKQGDPYAKQGAPQQGIAKQGPPQQGFSKGGPPGKK